MKKDPNVFIGHILDSICEIENYTERLSKTEFSASKMAQDAVIRRIEIIGEAVKNLPANFKVKHKEIPWRDIAGMRDILIHEYFGVNINVVWKTIKEDVPLLKEKISILAKQQKAF